MPKPGKLLIDMKQVASSLTASFMHPDLSAVPAELRVTETSIDHHTALRISL
jgi:hypothetical protein